MPAAALASAAHEIPDEARMAAGIDHGGDDGATGLNTDVHGPRGALLSPMG